MEGCGRNQLLTSSRSLQRLRPCFDTQSTSGHTDTEALAGMFPFALDMSPFESSQLWQPGCFFSATRRNTCTIGNFLRFLS